MLLDGVVVVSTTTSGSTTISCEERKDCDDDLLHEEPGSSVIVVRERLDPCMPGILGYMPDDLPAPLFRREPLLDDILSLLLLLQLCLLDEDLPELE